MSLRNRLRCQLRDRQFRQAYADEHLNLSISTQIKMIREQQRMSQATLAEKTGTKQAGISRIESANYSGWSIAVLRRLAEAFDLRLRVSFEEFGTLWKEVDNFNRESLQRHKFDDDPEFKGSAESGVADLATALASTSRSNHVSIDALLNRHPNASAADLQSVGQAQRQPDVEFAGRIHMGAAKAAMTPEMRA